MPMVIFVVVAAAAAAVGASYVVKKTLNPDPEKDADGNEKEEQSEWYKFLHPDKKE